MRPSGRWALPGALLLAWVGLMALDADALGTAAGVIGVVVGASLVAVVPGLADAVDRVAGLTRRFGGDPTPDPSDPPDRPSPVAAGAPEPDLATAVMREALGALADDVEGRRLVVWRVDRARDALVPSHALGAAPAPQPAAGNPLTWAAAERTGLRVEPPPSWAEGDVIAVPVDEDRVLTVETPPGNAPHPERLATGTRVLAALLRLADRETDARAERERMRHAVRFLQRLSRTHDDVQTPESLARSARELVDGQGALVAAWDGHEGRVLAGVGKGAPEAGRTFGPGDGDMAHAARTGAAVRRTPTDAGARPPLVSAREGRRGGAPFRVAIPLAGPGGAPEAVVAVWGDGPLAEEGVRLLEALGPLLSLQLRQATDLVRFRDRATVDALTGLPNRAAFDERLAEEEARFHRYRRPLSLLVIDLDRFKRVNDRYGHEAGDAVLREVAALVQQAVRDVDLAARYGGEELVVLMPETMLRAARDVAERIRSAVAGAAIAHDGTPIPVTASIGISGCPESVEEPAALFESADRALYAAKEGGRNRVEVAD